jgi:hypothetical protein
MPADETAFKAFFIVHERVKRIGLRPRHEICFRLASMKPLANIKNNPHTQKRLKELNTTIIEDPFMGQKVAVAGGLFGMNPQAVNRQAFTDDLTNSLRWAAKQKTAEPAERENNQSTTTETTDQMKVDDPNVDADAEMDADHIPTFSLTIRMFSFARKKRKVQAQALAIECAEDDYTQLVARIEASDEHNLLPKHTYFFTPTMLGQMEEEEYFNLLQTQQNLINTSVVIPVVGLSATALKTEITNKEGKRMSLLHEMLRQPSIRRLEPTQTTGKWFVQTTLDTAKEATRFLDYDLPDFFSQIQNKQNTKVAGFDRPSRIKRHGETTHSAKLIERLRSRFQSAPAAPERVRQPTKQLVSTIKYVSSDCTFAQAAATAPEPEPPKTPAGKKRRKDISVRPTPATQLAFDNVPVMTEVHDLVATLRHDIEQKIDGIAKQLQTPLTQEILDPQQTNNPTNAKENSTTPTPTPGITLQDIKSLIDKSVTTAMEKLAKRIDTILKERDNKVSDEIQELRDEVTDFLHSKQPATIGGYTVHTPNETSPADSTPPRWQSTTRRGRHKPGRGGGI